MMFIILFLYDYRRIFDSRFTKYGKTGYDKSQLVYFAVSRDTLTETFPIGPGISANVPPQSRVSQNAAIIYPVVRYFDYCDPVTKLRNKPTQTKYYVLSFVSNRKKVCARLSAGRCGGGGGRPVVFYFLFFLRVQRQLKD